ncbi:MAG: class I SAM-dependent methyltransferase [Actinobacteria bacterium]|nr:class I SAM-dependent methyltransferase [Actinomycetota bacterium]
MSLYGDLADLYDIAFDWDVTDEAAWLEERLGPECREVLEPGCGSGRMLEALARRGLHVTGIDNSARMLELARVRIAGLPAEVVEADMTAFDLGRVFDGAVCPINTLMHLTRDGVHTHLRAMAAALRPGARYLVQLGIVPEGEVPHSLWEAERDGVHLVVTWSPESRDGERGVELHRSTISVVSGPRAGEVHEQVHEMTIWDHAGWRNAVEGAGFEWAAVYDGAESGRARLAFDATGGLLWHELVRR